MPPSSEQEEDLPKAHQLERVEPDEDREQDQHRDQREAPMRGFEQHDRVAAYMIFSDASHSVLR